MATLPLYMYIVYNVLVIKLYTKEFYLFFVEDVLMRKGTGQKLYMYIRYPIFMEIFLYFTFGGGRSGLASFGEVTTFRGSLCMVGWIPKFVFAYWPDFALSNINITSKYSNYCHTVVLTNLLSKSIPVPCIEAASLLFVVWHACLILSTVFSTWKHPYQIKWQCNGWS